MDLDVFLSLNKLSVERFSEILGVSSNTIYAVLRGKTCHSSIIMRIEIATEGNVRSLDLYPKEYEQISKEINENRLRLKLESDRTPLKKVRRKKFTSR